MKVQIEEVKGYDCYTNFYGMDVTKDKLCTLLKKWHNVIESFVQTKTSDGYMLRIFAIGFTKRTGKQVKATCYAKSSQKKIIRKKMMEIMVNECQKSTLKDLTKKLYVLFTYVFQSISNTINKLYSNLLFSIQESIGKQITKECSKIFPIQNVLIKKVKLLKKPKFDLTKLMELYQERPEIERREKGEGKKEGEEPKNILAQKK